MALLSFFKREHKVTKSFSYSKNAVGLNFALRIDIKNELKSFEELLKNALADVQQELKKHV